MTWISTTLLKSGMWKWSVNKQLVCIAFDSSVGRAEDCSGPFAILRSLVRIRLEGVYYSIDIEPSWSVQISGTTNLTLSFLNSVKWSTAFFHPSIVLSTSFEKRLSCLHFSMLFSSSSPKPLQTWQKGHSFLAPFGLQENSKYMFPFPTVAERGLCEL